MIKHANTFDIEKVIKFYTEKDGVDITYVCTSDINQSDVPCDVFYRETPHPKFGNRYFGLYAHPITGFTYIINADKIEDFIFAMIKDKDGNMWYSRSHHDCLFIDGSMVDGGRAYIRASGKVYYYKVMNGKMTQVEEKELDYAN